jgi:hypothetical protein
MRAAKKLKVFGCQGALFHSQPWQLLDKENLFVRTAAKET